MYKLKEWHLVDTLDDGIRGTLGNSSGKAVRPLWRSGGKGVGGSTGGLREPEALVWVAVRIIRLIGGPLSWERRGALWGPYGRGVGLPGGNILLLALE